jgi:hypothetical protein
MPTTSPAALSLICAFGCLPVVAQQVITETFADASNQDPAASSGQWGAPLAPGARAGLIGGDGRHGAFSLGIATDTGLLVAGRRLFLLDTSATTVPAANTPAGVAQTVTDGRFQFSEMHVPADVHLRLVGSAPARITVAGVLDVQGVIESNGGSVVEPHISTAQTGQPGGAGGAFGGAGGQGGDRCAGLGPGNGQFDGRPGDDASLLAGHAYLASSVGTGGRGSSLYPASGLNVDQQFGTTPPIGLAYCLSAVAGGGGGSHYRSGADGRVVNIFSGTTPLANAATFMGSIAPASGAVQLFPFPPATGLQRSSEHFLLGGAGGGGAASNATMSLSLARSWASGAGAGGGGGAFALRTGRDLQLGPMGALTATGGSAANYVGVSAGAQVAPAGGGSGGSIVLLTGGSAILTGQIDVRGGSGGFFRRQGGNGIGPNAGIVEIEGGDGGDGFVRFEKPTPPTLSELAGMSPAPTGDNLGMLQELDDRTSDRSSWYATGVANAGWDGYEVLVDVDGDGTIDVTYDDSGAPGSQLAFEPGGPTTLPILVQFQSAATTPAGQVDPNGIGPWRAAVTPGPASSIAADGGSFVRFRLVFNRALFPQAVVRELRIQYAPSSSQAVFTTTPIATSATPPPITDHALAPLPGGGALLFGGETANGPYFPTFVLSGTTWTKQLSTSNPLARTDHALVLDEVRGENVMFGGLDPLGGARGDTWTFANGQWSLQTPTTSPPPRSGHAMAFDPSTGTCLLFGGRDGSGQLLADLWAWDGTDWTAIQQPQAPGARAGAAMAWDRLRSRLVLFGGDDGAAVLDDLWEWDGATWTAAPPTPVRPAARAKAVMAFDPKSERVVLHGGAAQNGCAGDTWTWDGIGWLQLLATQPVPMALEGSSLHADAQSGDLLLFGGNCGTNLSNDLWLLQLPVFARSQPFGSGCAGSNGTPTLDVANGTAPVVGTTVDLAYANAPLTPFVSGAIGAVGWSRTSYLGLPLPLALGPAGLQGCTLYQSTDLTVPLTIAPNAAGTTWSIAIPNGTQLIGAEFYVQGLHPEFQPFANWAALTNAIALRIGTQ